MDETEQLRANLAAAVARQLAVMAERDAALARAEMAEAEAARLREVAIYVAGWPHKDGESALVDLARRALEAGEGV